MNDVFKELTKTIKERKENYDENSYTCYLFKEGINKILKKVGEETAETIIAAKDSNIDKEAIVGEVSDLFYHVLVMLEELNIPFENVVNELEERTKKISNLKFMKTTDKNT